MHHFYFKLLKLRRELNSLVSKGKLGHDYVDCNINNSLALLSERPWGPLHCFTNSTMNSQSRYSRLATLL